MPIYRYKCENCEHERELISSFKNRISHLEDECEECGENCHVLMIGLPSFALKGEGWSKDGYEKWDDSNPYNQN